MARENANNNKLSVELSWNIHLGQICTQIVQKIPANIDCTVLSTKRLVPIYPFPFFSHHPPTTMTHPQIRKDGRKTFIINFLNTSLSSSLYWWIWQPFCTNITTETKVKKCAWNKPVQPAAPWWEIVATYRATSVLSGHISRTEPVTQWSAEKWQLQKVPLTCRRFEGVALAWRDRCVLAAGPLCQRARELGLYAVFVRRNLINYQLRNTEIWRGIFPPPDPICSVQSHRVHVASYRERPGVWHHTGHLKLRPQNT